MVEEVLQDVGTLDFGKEMTARAIKRSEQLFVSLQLAAPDWILPGATRTGIVYQRQGNPPPSHE